MPKIINLPSKLLSDSFSSTPLSNRLGLTGQKIRAIVKHKCKCRRLVKHGSCIKTQPPRQPARLWENGAESWLDACFLVCMFTELDYASLPDQLCWVIRAIKNHNTPFHSAIKLIACKLCVRRVHACPWQRHNKHDAISPKEALLFSLRRNIFLGQHKQQNVHSSLLMLFDDWKTVFYTSQSQWFAFYYFEQN